jgi:phosphoribosylaminoimidazole-succinocarboxamide synthase
MKDIYMPSKRIARRTMNRRVPIYEGKAKQLFEGPEPGTLIQHFKDDATAFNNLKKGTINGKGVLNNRISEFLMLRLTEIGIPNHFIRTLNMREQLVRAVEIIPLEVIVRNIAAGSFSQRFGVEEGSILPYPIIEFCLKNDKLNDPIVAPEIIVAFQWAQPGELEEITAMALRINDFLSGLFLGLGIKLVDFKLEFGRHYEGNTVQVILADEISPDCCRLWDTKTGDKMDKDRFRRDMGKVEEAYREVARRLGVLPENEVAPKPAATSKPKASKAKKK